MKRVDVGDAAERARDMAGREWVLDQIGDWMSQEDPQNLLMTGEPGSGKTALAAWLAGAGPAPVDPTQSKTLERVRAAWRAVHFCVAENKRGSLDPARFSQSLARQLADRYVEFAAAVLARIKPELSVSQVVEENLGSVVGIHIDQLVVNTRPEDVFNRVVRDPLEELGTRMPNEILFVLVDALDEALTIRDPNIVDLLVGSADLRNVRFFLTSRNEQRILSSFRGARRLNLSASEHKKFADADISIYVTRRLGQDPAGQGEASSKLVQEAGRGLIAQADGNFLYARFVLDEVTGGKRSLTDLAELPTGLFGLYRHYLERLIPDMRSYGHSNTWRDRFRPLLGCLSVATPAAPLDSIARWLRVDKGEVVTSLSEIAQLTEEVAEAGEIGLRLYHRSMADFLATAQYRENGSTVLNSFHAPPMAEHLRIANYYRQSYRGKWTACDTYGLRHLVSHLASLRDAESDSDAKQERARDLFDVILDPEFQAAQIERLNSPYTTLVDLQTAVRIAIQGDDQALLACVAGYRSAARGQTIAPRIFSAVDSGDHDAALEAARHYEWVSDWARVLDYYLACEAAQSGFELSVFAAIERASRIPLVQSGDLCDALLVRAARALGNRTASMVRPGEWLARFIPDRNIGDLLSRYGAQPPLDPAERVNLLQIVGAQIGALMNEGSVEFTSAVPFLPAGQSVPDALDLRNRLARLASDPQGQGLIDSALELFLQNPYPWYRDIALIAIGLAVTEVPDWNWARQRLRLLITGGLDREGVTFTFDLPSVLLEEARSRGLDALSLGVYMMLASQQYDAWGTQARVRSAAAAAAFWQGRRKDAIAELDQAAAHLGGYAGYMSVAALALANRRREFGFKAGETKTRALVDIAGAKAADVRDPLFRSARQDLVQQYRTWAEHDPHDVSTELETIDRLIGHDERTVYIDYLSAEWAASGLKGLPGLRALVPFALVDGTRLDGVLGRLIGVRVREMSNDELREAIRVCGDQLATGRPWEVAAAPRAYS